jgi:hypothetical protein
MRQVSKSSELSIVRVDRWQQIQEFENSDFGRFARGRVELILVVGARKDTSGVDLSHQCWEGYVARDQHFADSRLGEFKGRVVRTRELI